MENSIIPEVDNLNRIYLAKVFPHALSTTEGGNSNAGRVLGLTSTSGRIPDWRHSRLNLSQPSSNPPTTPSPR